MIDSQIEANKITMKLAQEGHQMDDIDRAMKIIPKIMKLFKKEKTNKEETAVIVLKILSQVYKFAIADINEENSSGVKFPQRETDKQAIEFEKKYGTDQFLKVCASVINVLFLKKSIVTEQEMKDEFLLQLNTMTTYLEDEKSKD